MILPHIEQEVAYTQMNIAQPYNATAANLDAARTGVAAFVCPTNRLADRRGLGSRRDRQGFGVTDYVPLPYVEGPAGGAAFAPAPMTGAPYDLGFYKKFLASDSGTVKADKSVQLDTTAAGGLIGRIDAALGVPSVTSIRDGSSNSILMYEDTGRNEDMDGAGAVNDAYDPITGSKRLHWRWAEPDTAAGISQRINNGIAGGMDRIDPGISDPANKCFNRTWRAHDCGPNNEPFSFHNGGVHFVFADGHVVYIRDSISLDVIKALGTRANGENEQGFEYIE
jgi:prepilin-type processing-associated H-X9-DG protein